MSWNWLFFFIAYSGKLGGSQKTELELALQRYTENRERRELLAGEKSSLEQILELQARKIEMVKYWENSPIIFINNLHSFPF